MDNQFRMSSCENDYAANLMGAREIQCMLHNNKDDGKNGD